MNQKPWVQHVHPRALPSVSPRQVMASIELCLTCTLKIVTCNGATLLVVPAFHPSPQEACDKFTDENLRSKTRFSARHHFPVASETCGATELHCGVQSQGQHRRPTRG